MKMTIKVRCHPEQMRRSCTRGEENGKSNFVINRKETASVISVIDSSLRVTVLLTHFPTQHSYPRSE